MDQSISTSHAKKGMELHQAVKLTPSTCEANNADSQYGVYYSQVQISGQSPEKEQENANIKAILRYFKE
jgi:hypothetical protein